MGDDHRPDLHAELLANVKRDLDELTTLLEEVSGAWGYEDFVYRFWYRSFKVFHIQDATERMVAALRALTPDGCSLDGWFTQIVEEGTGREFSYEDNERWLEVTRPMVEAFFHARFMVEMAVKYGCELDGAPTMLPSGWAALLGLYRLR